MTKRKAETNDSDQPVDEAQRERTNPDASPPDPAKAARERTREQSQMALKRKVGIFYDLQRLRIQAAGRTYTRPGGVTINLHEFDVYILEQRAKQLEQAEKAALRDIEDHLKTIPFYEKVLSDKARFKGVGPTMAGVILSSFDIIREDTVSRMWAFCGLKPIPARRCKKCHAVIDEDGGMFLHRKERVFKPKNKDGTVPAPEKRVRCTEASIPIGDTYESARAQHPEAGQKLPYNAFLRTRLIGVLGPVLLKVGSPWKKFYDDYKHRKASAGWGRSDAHRHQAAIRYMIKMLLLEIWREWRTIEGLPVREPYAAEYLGKRHHESPSPDMAPEIEAELEQIE